MQLLAPRFFADGPVACFPCGRENRVGQGVLPIGKDHVECVASDGTNGFTTEWLVINFP